MYGGPLSWTTVKSYHAGLRVLMLWLPYRLGTIVAFCSKPGTAAFAAAVFSTVARVEVFCTRRQLQLLMQHHLSQQKHPHCDKLEKHAGLVYFLMFVFEYLRGRRQSFKSRTVT